MGLHGNKSQTQPEINHALRMQALACTQRARVTIKMLAQNMIYIVVIMTVIITRRRYHSHY